MRKFNIEEFIWLLILITLTIYLVFLIKSGAIYNYLSIDTTKNLYIVFVILPVLVIVQGMKALTFKSRVDNSFKFIPIIFMLSVGVLLLLRLYMYDDNKEIIMFNNELSKNAIEINHETHYILEDLDKEGDKYLDNYIIFTGFIYKYEGEKFILAREEMNCCAADSYIIGVKTLANDKFQEGEWIKALGKISFDGEYYLELEEYIKINTPNNLYF